MMDKVIDVMKIWLISDTHGKHEELLIPDHIDMMEADEKLGLYQKPTKFYTIEDIERCVENWGLCKDERVYIDKIFATIQVVKNSLTT